MDTFGNLVFLDSVVKMPLMKLPVRTVVVPVPNGSIMISPGSMLTADQLSRCGPVTDLVASNLYHCGGIQNALTVFPQARAWGVEGAAKKKPYIKWTNELTESSWPFSEMLTGVTLNGMPSINEVVFVHKPSRSLIVTDLSFNMTAVSGFGAWFILSLFGTYKKFGVSSLFLKGIKDRSAFQSSIENLFAHDFDNIVVSHGELIRGGGKGILRQALMRHGFRI